MTPTWNPELEALKRAQYGVESMAAFVARTAPAYARVPEHLQCIYDLFEQSRQRPIYATVSMPPRHGKTETFRLGLAYRVACDPACLNVYATFGEDLAEQTGLKVRARVQRLGIPLSSSKVLDWQTPLGGGVKSTSVGGSITGRGVNGGIIVVDDSVKGREAANSRRERDRIWDWLRSDVLSRLEGGGSIIICNTRWHEDDPIGRILEDDLGLPWRHINLPAVHDGHYRPVDERLYPEQAHPLWTEIDSMNPGRAGAMAWYAVKRRAGEHDWWSLYQGTPRSKELRMFALDPPRFELSGWRWEGKRGVITLDPAATEKTSADFTAIGANAMEGWGNDARMSLRKAARGQMTVPNAARLALTWQRVFRLPVAVEAVGGFKAIPQMIRETAPRIALIEAPARGDKVTRAIPLSKAWASGNVLVPLGGDDRELDALLRRVWAQICAEQRVSFPYPVEAEGTDWLDPYLDEMRKFTGLNDAHDDQVDMTAHGWNTLYREIPVSRTGRIELAADF